MEFTWPVALWTAVLVPLLWAGYRLALRRQQRAAEVFADAPLFARLVVRPSAWQRRLPMLLYLAGVLLLAVATARPVAAVPLPVNRAAVVVAVDTSGSMIAPDVSPTRLDAARRAARAIASLVPRSTRLGLVAFSEYGTVLLPPSTDRAAFLEALDRLQPQSATSMGGGLLEAIRILPGRAQVFGERLERLARRGGSAPPPGSPNPAPMPLPAPAPSPQEPRLTAEDLVPASVIVFSDGVSNFGPDPMEAAGLAREARVRVFLVGVGTPGGAVTRIDGQLVLVPFDAAGMERIARLTEGRYFPSPDDEALREVVRRLGRIIGWEPTRLEISFLLVAAAAAIVVSGGGLSLVWFRRVP